MHSAAYLLANQVHGSHFVQSNDTDKVSVHQPFQYQFYFKHQSHTLDEKGPDLFIFKFCIAAVCYIENHFLFGLES